jgi:predicted secreted protein
MGVLKGKNLLLGIGGDPKGYATSCTLDLSVDTTETASTTYKQMNNSSSGGWKEYEISKKSWTCSSENMTSESMTEYNALFKAFVAGVPVAIQFGAVSYTTSTTDDNNTAKFTTGCIYKGNAIITGLSITGSTEDEVTYSVSLTGTGELTNA